MAKRCIPCDLNRIYKQFEEKKQRKEQEKRQARTSQPNTIEPGAHIESKKAKRKNKEAQPLEVELQDTKISE